LHFEADMQGSS